MGFDSSHNNNNTSNSNDFNNNKIMLSAIFALAFVILLVIILHLYARCALRPPRRHFGVPTASFIYSHQVRHVETVPPKTGLDQDVINTLPSFLYKELHGRDNEECAVCLSMLENQELARRLPNCNHIFHLECIDTWLTGQPTCPICRSDATPRLSPLDREPPRGSARIEIAVATSGGDQHEHDQQCQGLTHNNNSSSNKGIHINGIGPSSTSSSSFRLGSFRRIIGLERSSSSRRIQANNAELDLERQGQ